MEIKLANIGDCTGCAACSDVCPKQCISFDYNGTLHLYPIIDNDKCIKCGKCVRTCPILNVDRKEGSIREQKYYAAWESDYLKRAKSTSGGAGAAIAEWGVKNGWKICGSLFDSAWHLSHKVGVDEEFLSKIRQSKYLQSNTQGVFQGILEALKNGEKILFFGTPCQVDGVLHVCGKSDNLLTVEIICHGVNSPRVWSDYVEYLESSNKDKLVAYNFRDKSRGWERTKGGPNLTVAMKFSNSNTKIIPARYNLFHYWFGQHYLLREACFNCKYRKKQRVADLVIGDFWGIEKILPNADIKSGVSVIIASNARALQILSHIDCEMIETSENDTIKVLKGFIEKRSVDARRRDIEKMKSFSILYQSNEFKYIAKHYPAPTVFSHFIARIKSFLHI